LFVVIFRTIILFSIVFVVVRLMGKRQIAQMQPYEIAILIMISALAAIPMEDIGMPLFNSMIPILMLFAFQVLIAFFSQKSEKARSILCGRPSIVVENGKILENELRDMRMNINELQEMLRVQGYPNISEVEFAIFETNGQLSVVPKSQNRPVTPGDLDLETEYEGLPYPLVVDGNVNYHNLAKAGLNEDWLKRELAKFNIHDLQEVLLANLDTSGNLYFQTKNKKEKLN